MTLKLVMIRCPDNVAPERREVRGGEFSIGRGQDNGWVIADPERHLSKRHCRLVYGAGVGDWELHDLSANGTFLNQAAEPVGRGASQKLRSGDRIKFGLYELEVIIDEDGEAAVPDRGGALGSHHRSDVAGANPWRRDLTVLNDSRSPGPLRHWTRPIRRSCRRTSTPWPPIRSHSPGRPSRITCRRSKAPSARPRSPSSRTTGTSIRRPPRGPNRRPRHRDRRRRRSHMKSPLPPHRSRRPRRPRTRCTIRGWRSLPAMSASATQRSRIRKTLERIGRHVATRERSSANLDGALEHQG